MIVEVYRNLHLNCWSVRNSKTKRIIRHSNTLILKNATFHVSEKGRKRVLRKQQKNVHAFIRGTITRPKEIGVIWRKVRYDPYAMNFFRDQDSDVVTHAERVVFWANGTVWYTEGVPSTAAAVKFGSPVSE